MGLRVGAGVELAGWGGATFGGGGLAFPAAALSELRVRGSRPFLVLDADTDVVGGSLRLWSDWVRLDVLAGDWFRRDSVGELATCLAVAVMLFLLDTAGEGFVILPWLLSRLNVLASGGCILRLLGSTTKWNQLHQTLQLWMIVSLCLIFKERIWIGLYLKRNPKYYIMRKISIKSKHVFSKK